MPTSSLQDQWSLRLAAALKATALNSRLLPQVPWESLLFLPGELEHVNCASQLPESLLEDFANVRDAVLVKIADKGLTITDMQRAVVNDARALCALDPSFAIEIAYLEGAAEDKLRHKAHETVLAALPSERAPDVTWQGALASLKAVGTGPLCKAGGTSLTGEIEGVIGMLQKLSEGQGPDVDRVQHMSAFYRAVLHRVAFFAKWSQQGGGPSVFGRPALMRAIDDVKRDIETDHWPRYERPEGEPSWGDSCLF